MKQAFITLLLVVGLFKHSKAQEKLFIDLSKSNVHWYGEYTFYFGGHDGTIDFKDGYFIKTGDKITGGEFIIDMKTIKNLDIDNAESKQGLVDHLKDPDFFDVSKHPLAFLTITNVYYESSTKAKIYAKLSIKGKTNPISFHVDFNYEMKTMTTKFKIDRMKWDISYNSKIRDGAISDAIGFEVDISL